MKVITFLSDFGLTDGYVGSVKGAIFSNFPEARIIDITHDIKPFQIKEAAYTLMSYYAFYPKSTVHLTVVDPGVGGKRAPLIIKTGKESPLLERNVYIKFILLESQFLKHHLA